MRVSAKRDLAEIRRQAYRVEAQEMRARLAENKARVRELKKSLVDWQRQRKAERRNRLKALRSELVGVNARADRQRRLLEISSKREQFRVWWAAALKERLRRIEEIRNLEKELRNWQRTAPQRRKEMAARVTERISRVMADYDRNTLAGAARIRSELDRASKAAKSEEVDQRIWRSNRRRDAKRPLRATRSESREELVSGVEANLETPQELAWWKANRGSILRTARELGKTSGDAIAEMVREQVEGDPERAIEFLSDDADAWVAAELKRQGFAA